jgi:imidazolonepropionase-like amidohydrolase
VLALTETHVFSDGKIVAVGNTENIRQIWKDSDFEAVIDATGKCVLPGFVDAHTHPVWAGDRVHEFAMKVQSIDKMQIPNIVEAIRCTKKDILSVFKHTTNFAYINVY